jgi:hypothetical protein
MRTSTLTEGQSRICEALVSAPLPWLTVEQLLGSLQTDTDLVVDALADLEGLGWLASWEDWPEGIAVTLTPWAAEQFGVRIVEDGPRFRAHWVPEGVPEPAPPRAGRVFMDSHALGDVVDPSPSVEETLIAAEEPTRKAIRCSRQDPGAWPDARREAQRACDAKKKRVKARQARRERKRCEP